ncbi:hypothetical protein PAESOLCIP111_03025 [Paenibacillus solanacearum]|uniref:Integral membrane protein n=1 Tax=Paenibacillus solanacearum TaxID=2048548 RepID=A0A916K1S7_9BACL|nr:DUF6223 family protein [Paenibacillus solanacearum]CAG7628499.1 hypothetical protein PAESOLCIP111_03025 [Paenibacillus solanacearum]
MKMKLVSFVTICALLLVPTIVSAEATSGNIGYGLTPGRLKTLVAAVVGLISVVIGGLSLVRSSGRFGTGNGRAGAIVAIGAGLFGIVLAGLHLVKTTGGFGTGNGRAGAIVAIGMGLLGIVLAGITLARSRRTG